MPISVVLADDHPLVVSSLKAYFDSRRDITVIGATDDGEDVLSLLATLKPDVLVLDLTMAPTSGLEVLRRLRQESSPMRVVVLSMHSSVAHALRAVRLGALGYVTKQAPASELVTAIKAAAGGKRYLSPPLSDELLRQHEERLESGKIDLFDTLSPRQREVMKYAALGLSSSQTAEKLLIGKRTVESHIAEVNEKLGLKSRSELVRYAVRVGLVTADEE
jgi:two-component system response regulator NreC